MSEPTQPQRPPEPAPTPAPASPAAPASFRGVLATSLVSLLVLLWYGVRYLSLALEARGRTAALIALPPWWFYVLVLLATLVATAVAVAAKLRRLPADSRSYRLLPVAAVLVLAIQTFLVPPCQLPLPVEDVLAVQLSTLDAEALTIDGRLPADPAKLDEMLDPEPYRPPFIGPDGNKLPKWRIIVRTGCTGPDLEVPAGVETGSLFYCLSADQKVAWVSVVGLGGSLTGAPAIATAGGQPLVAVLQVPDPEVANLPPEPAPVPEGAPPPKP